MAAYSLPPDNGGDIYELVCAGRSTTDKPADRRRWSCCCGCDGARRGPALSVTQVRSMLPIACACARIDNSLRKINRPTLSGSRGGALCHGVSRAARSFAHCVNSSLGGQAPMLHFRVCHKH